MATSNKPSAARSTPNYTGPFITVTVLFGIFGFLTNLNSNHCTHLGMGEARGQIRWLDDWVVRLLGG